MNPDLFQNPFPNDPPTSSYGDTGTRYHYGYDVDPGTGVAVPPPGDGWRVAYVGQDAYPGQSRGNGNWVILEKGGVAVAYLHGQGAPPVRVDQIVNRDDTVLHVGNTGSSRGAHLHMEVLTNYDATRFPTFRSQGRDGTARHLDPAALFGRALDDIAFVGLGANNDYVESVQRVLVQQGLLRDDQVDGDFGPTTEAAVRTLQSRLGVEVDGVFGPLTRDAAEAQGLWVEDGRMPERPDPTPSPTPDATDAAFSTVGPFSTTAVGAVLGVRGGTPLGALDAEPSYALGRAVLGDSEGAAALEFLDRRLGSGDGVLVQRFLAMGLHEGQLHAGRGNPDPASGYNLGTFQLGGRGTTPDVTAANQDRLLAHGLSFLAARGHSVDASSLTLMDRDVITHVGYLADRARGAFRSPLAEDQLIRELGDASIQGEALVHLVHHRVQGGVRDIGVNVARWTDARTGLGVDLDVLAARAREPEEVRREPAMPTLDRRLHPSRYDTSRGPVTSPAVAQWQAVLRENGFLDEEPDGIYGDRTIAATRAAQRTAGLSPDGVVGPDTWGAYSETLGRVVDAQRAPDATPSDLAAAREVLDANRQTVDLMRQVDGLVDNLLDTHTDGYVEARTALFAAARGDAPLTPARVHDLLAAQEAPVTGLSDLEARTIAGGVNVGIDLATANPEVAAARALVSDARSAAPQERGPLDDPSRSQGDGTLVGDGRTDVTVSVSRAPVDVER